MSTIQHDPARTSSSSCPFWTSLTQKPTTPRLSERDGFQNVPHGHHQPGRDNPARLPLPLGLVTTTRDTDINLQERDPGHGQWKGDEATSTSQIPLYVSGFVRAVGCGLAEKYFTARSRVFLYGLWRGKYSSFGAQDGRYIQSRRSLLFQLLPHQPCSSPGLFRRNCAVCAAPQILRSSLLLHLHLVIAHADRGEVLRVSFSQSVQFITRIVDTYQGTVLNSVGRGGRGPAPTIGVRRPAPETANGKKGLGRYSQP